MNNLRRKIGNKLVNIKPEKMCFSEYTKALKETATIFLSKTIDQEKNCHIIDTSFEEHIYKMSVNNRDGGKI